MREDIKERLAALSREEHNTSISEMRAPDVQKLYGKPGRFIIERRRVSLISTGRADKPISLRVHPVRIPFPEHSHDFIELMYVYSGKITHTVGEEKITVGEGDTLIFGKEARHSVIAAEDTDIGINVVISAELYERLLSDIRRSSSLDTAELSAMLDHGKDRYLYVSSRENENVRGIIESLVHTCLMTESDGYVIETEARLLLSYLVGCGSLARHTEAKERLLLDYICSSYASATLGEAAEILGFSEPYLSRWCRRQLGASFKELLMAQRFYSACELLSDTDMPIGDVISAVGYENSSYFHKEFKARLGMTPKEYRRTDGGIK